MNSSSPKALLPPPKSKREPYNTSKKQKRTQYTYATKAPRSRSIESKTEAYQRRIRRLRQQAMLRREPISRTATDMVQHCEAKSAKDPILNKDLKSRANPYSNKNRCTIL